MGYKKAFPQIVTYILQKAFFKHALEELVNEGVQRCKQEEIEVLLFLCQILLKKKNSTIQKITV